MVERVTAFQAADGSYHGSWDEAAECEAVGIFKTMLPGLLAERDAVAVEMAHALFAERNAELLSAVHALINLIQTEPRSMTSEIAERLAPNIEHLSERRGFWGRK